MGHSRGEPGGSQPQGGSQEQAPRQASKALQNNVVGPVEEQGKSTLIEDDLAAGQGRNTSQHSHASDNISVVGLAEGKWGISLVEMGS